VWAELVVVLLILPKLARRPSLTPGFAADALRDSVDKIANAPHWQARGLPAEAAKPVVPPINLSINLDSRPLAQVLIDQIGDIYKNVSMPRPLTALASQDIKVLTLPRPSRVRALSPDVRAAPAFLGGEKKR
jgi:hypothetical protein